MSDEKPLDQFSTENEKDILITFLWRGLPVDAAPSNLFQVQIGISTPFYSHSFKLVFDVFCSSKPRFTGEHYFVVMKQS